MVEPCDVSPMDELKVEVESLADDKQIDDGAERTDDSEARIRAEVEAAFEESRVYWPIQLETNSSARVRIDIKTMLLGGKFIPPSPPLRIANIPFTFHSYMTESNNMRFLNVVVSAPDFPKMDHASLEIIVAVGVVPPKRGMQPIKSKRMMGVLDKNTCDKGVGGPIIAECDMFDMLDDKGGLTMELLVELNRANGFPRRLKNDFIRPRAYLTDAVIVVKESKKMMQPIFVNRALLSVHSQTLRKMFYDCGKAKKSDSNSSNISLDDVPVFYVQEKVRQFLVLIDAIYQGEVVCETAEPDDLLSLMGIAKKYECNSVLELCRVAFEGLKRCVEAGREKESNEKKNKASKFDEKAVNEFFEDIETKIRDCEIPSPLPRWNFKSTMEHLTDGIIVVGAGAHKKTFKISRHVLALASPFFHMIFYKMGPEPLEQFNMPCKLAKDVEMILRAIYPDKLQPTVDNFRVLCHLSSEKEFYVPAITVACERFLMSDACKWPLQERVKIAKEHGLATAYKHCLDAVKAEGGFELEINLKN